MAEDIARIPVYQRVDKRKRSTRQIIAYTLVDAADEALVSSKGPWTMHSGGYVEMRPDRQHRHLYLHRFILGLEPGDKRHGDHINRDKLDNRRENLRIVDQRLNTHNQPSRGGMSVYRGVTAQNGKWIAQGQVNGQYHYLGRYTDEAEAGRVASQWRLANMLGAVD